MRIWVYTDISDCCSTNSKRCFAFYWLEFGGEKNIWTQDRATIMCDGSQSSSNIYLIHDNLNELDISLQLQSKCVFPKTLAVLMIL